MPIYYLPIITITQTLENDVFLAEALFYSEVTRFNVDEGTAIENLHANLRKLIEDALLVSLHQGSPAGTPEIGEFEITLKPPQHQKAWRKSITMKFPTVRWSHGDSAQIAYLPTLGIEIAATSPSAPATLDKLIHQHILSALGRRGGLNSLRKLTRLQRCRELKLEHQSIEVSLLTPKQTAMRREKDEEEKQSVLADAATDLTKELLPAAYEMDEMVHQLAESLTGRFPRSVLVVGKSGVGKSALIYELVRRRAELQLGAFWETNGSRLIAGMSGFGQWQERCQKLWREAALARAILYLGNLIELMEVGKSIANSYGVASFLRPYITRGDVLVIAECTNEQLALIERTDPHLLAAFNQIRIEEPSPERCRNILLNVTIAETDETYFEAGEAGIELDGIERIDRLHRRYASYSAFPGRPVRFLRYLLRDQTQDRGGALTADSVITAFSRETGLPRVFLDEREKLDLDATRAWFEERVIGQPGVIDLIVDLLATVKAGLTRPNKPIASLLFIGPTGVGKTEMAKSLAEFLFQDRRRIVRFDMSEYADPAAVNRLIGGSFDSEGLLTAKVREQPFSVLLLDEFEKAHFVFFDLLLQVLGEGRLSDAMGRVADFTNTVVIMTSNLGAESFQRGMIGFGQAESTRKEAIRHFTNVVRQTLSPELFNRIDRIIPFAPLDEQSVLQITEREIGLIKTRDGIRYRGAMLNISDDVTRHLAHRGYDARYGARLLKRVIERELLVPLSEELNQHPREIELSANVWVDHGRLNFKTHEVSEGNGKHAASLFTDRSLVELVNQCMETRREARILEHSPTALNLQNEIFAIERAEKRMTKNQLNNPAVYQRVAELPRLKSALEAINDYTARISSIENQALLAVYGKIGVDRNEIAARFASALHDWEELLISTYSLRFKQPDQITLSIFCEVTRTLFHLAGIYYRIARYLGGRVAVDQFILKRGERTRKSVVSLERKPLERQVEKVQSFLATPRDDVIGIVLGIEAPLANPRFTAERGLHQLMEEKKVIKCLVHTSESSFSEYQPPPGIERHGSIGHQEKRRSYHIDQFYLDDTILGRKLPWSGRDLENTIGELIEETLIRQARMLLDK